MSGRSRPHCSRRRWGRWRMCTARSLPTSSKWAIGWRSWASHGANWPAVSSNSWAVSMAGGCRRSMRRPAVRYLRRWRPPNGRGSWPPATTAPTAGSSPRWPRWRSPAAQPHGSHSPTYRWRPMAPSGRAPLCIAISRSPSPRRRAASSAKCLPRSPSGLRSR